jgi:anaerobic dimethyl sulfoxide reductase subunit A
MPEKDILSKTLNETVLSRRSFLKWSAALGGTAALAGKFKFGLEPIEEGVKTAQDQGKWIFAACWHNCGGRDCNYALVQDGVVIRQKTDDTHPDSPDHPQQRGCARGRMQRHQVLGVDRLKYPMKRKNWEPGGGKKELRGIDEWVRISWDEAYDLIATESKRILDTYGNKAILLPQFASSTVLNAMGGAVPCFGVSSDGAWPIPSSLMCANLNTQPPDRMSYRKAKLIVLWGSDPAWSSAGDPTYNFLQAKHAGTKFIFVGPCHNDSMQVLADQWIPCRPGTDAALLIGMAYHMITNNLQDQEFLDKYTLGFDTDHMPEGADPKENFKDYVLGTYDGVPKTPEWASEICGTHPREIRQFAEEIATTKPMIFNGGAAPARTQLGQQYCQAFLTVGWMTGNVGIEGAAVDKNYHSGASYGGSSLVFAGSSGASSPPNPFFAGGAGVYGGYGFSQPNNTEFFAIAYEETWDAILNGEFTLTVRGTTPVDIKMIWTINHGSGGNGLNQSAGIMKGIEAYRKVDFVVSSDIVLSTKSKYADIVLPDTTPWEEEQGGFLYGNPEALFFYSQVIQPHFEARDCGYTVQREFAKRFGIDPDDVYPMPPKQQVFNQLAGAQVIKSDASGYETLLTITADDIAKMGVEGQPQTGRVSLQEFIDKGVYQVERSPDDPFTFIPGAAFREDPEANPLGTASGKLEIHCQELSDKIAAYGFSTIPPIAQYHPPIEGYETTFSDFTNKVKGEYPFQLVTQHYMRRSHSVFDNISQLRKAFPQSLWMNSLDAESLGIQHGETVLVSSAHGKVLRPVAVSDRLMPGVVIMGEGAWVELDEDTGIDHAGATNTLCGTHPTGQGEEPWNTTNVRVDKWSGKPLAHDYTWPHRIPIKEG